MPRSAVLAHSTKATGPAGVAVVGTDVVTLVADAPALGDAAMSLLLLPHPARLNANVIAPATQIADVRFFMVLPDVMFSQYGPRSSPPRPQQP